MTFGLSFLKTMAETTDNAGEYYVDGKLTFKTNNWMKISKKKFHVEKGLRLVRLKGLNFFGKPTKNNHGTSQ